MRLGSCLREYRSIKIRSTVPRMPYSSDEDDQADHSQVVLTDGDIPFLVSMMPCTIHGWRPLSVSSQPAVFIRNGSTDHQVAHHRNTREVASFSAASATAPTAHTSRTSTARYAITRMPQYWMNTFGT